MNPAIKLLTDRIDGLTKGLPNECKPWRKSMMQAQLKLAKQMLRMYEENETVQTPKKRY